MGTSGYNLCLGLWPCFRTVHAYALLLRVSGWLFCNAMRAKTPATVGLRALSRSPSAECLWICFRCFYAPYQAFGGLL